MTSKVLLSIIHIQGKGVSLDGVLLIGYEK